MDNSQQFIGFSESDVIEDNYPHPTPLVTSLQELWLLAKIASNNNPDPILAAIMSLGLRPTKIEDVGYEFAFRDMNILYLCGDNKSIIRFTIPKIERTTQLNADMIKQKANRVNSLIVGAKISIISNEVWIIYEHFSGGVEDYTALIEHILSQLYSAVTLFQTATEENVKKF